MNLAEKHNIKWENRYDILTVEVRHKIIDDLIEPFKKRGAELKKLIDEHPRLIDENGNSTDRLLIVNNKYIDGHIIEKGSDQNGNYAIFQARNRIENEQWQRIIKTREKLSLLAKLQWSLNESNIDYSKIQETKSEIDTLFVEVFDVKNTNIKARTKANADFPKYCEIGSLFAQGYISKNGFNFYYKELKFESAKKLAEYLKDEVLKIDTDVRQYINDTLTDNGQKNFYRSKGMIKKVFSYCEANNIKTTQFFQSKYNTLNNLH